MISRKQQEDKRVVSVQTWLLVTLFVIGALCVVLGR